MGSTLLSVEAAVGAIGRGYASAPVILGGMVLTGVEVPDRLQVGGRQMLAVHRLVGGGRIIDALGNDPDRLELAGRFVGPEAQARAQTLERMRTAGVPVAFSGAGLSGLVWVAQFAYGYEAKGAICTYRLVLERTADPVETLPPSAGGLSALIGNDAASAAGGIAQAIGGISSGTFTLAGQVGTVVGQITPVATLIGAGGALTSATAGLAKVSAATQAGVDLSTTPASAMSLVAGLAQAGAGLSGAIAQAGANLEAIQPTNAPSLSALTQNAQLLSSSVDAGGLVNRAAANAATATNEIYTGPLVSAG